LDTGTPEAKAIIACLIVFHSRVVGHGLEVIQMRARAGLNHYFNEEFRAQKNVLDIFDRKLQVEAARLRRLSKRLRTA